LTTTQTRPSPSDEPTKVETITVTRRSPWPHFAALTLALVTGPTTAWLLLYASLGSWERFGVAAGVPVGLGALAVGLTRFDQPGRFPR
jgi:hypothetical protein